MDGGFHGLAGAALAEESGEESCFGRTFAAGGAEHAYHEGGDRQEHYIELYRVEYLVHRVEEGFQQRACMRAWEMSM